MFTFDRHARISILVVAFLVVAVGAACKSSSTTRAAASTQKLPIGWACTKDGDCGTAPFYCMVEHPGGYCMRGCTTDADCPSEAVCWLRGAATASQNDGMKGECRSKCNVNTDCRAGYDCLRAAIGDTDKVSHAFCDTIEAVDAN